MQSDEQAIRRVVQQWLDASRSGDYETVLTLMTNDVVFMVPGNEPFGRDAFAQQSQQLEGISIDGTSDIKELKVLGEWAFVRSHLTVKMTLRDGKTNTRSGYTLTLFRKSPEGNWQIARDANLLTPNDK
jgi:uncharacterized protein (TIGR02246 family)